MRDFLLHHLLRRSAERYPDKTAVVFKEKSVTYSDLECQSNRLALTLQQMGIKKGDRVGILLTKSVEQIVSLFGILKSGALYVPIDPAAPTDRILSIVRRCGIECLVTASGNLETLLSYPEDEIAFNSALVIGKNVDEFKAHVHINVKYLYQDNESNGGASEINPVDLSDNSPAYILHTSGSTGHPKGVAISHINALTFVEMAADYFNITAADRFCSHAPLHFDLSVFDIFVAVKCGATIVLLPEILSTFPLKLAEYIEKEQITVWNSVSSVLTMLADKGMLERHSFRFLRLVHFSGDIMPVKYLRVLIKYMSSASFYNIYGQTEANSSLCYPILEISDNDSWRIPIGKPFPNFDVFALNVDQQVISRSDEEGELYVSGSSVALGYWNDLDMTREKFVPDPRYPLLEKVAYKTGDLVRIDGSGNYLFTGRKDHMIKSRGYRIELAEIELVLSGHPEIAAAVVIPVSDEIVGNRISAIMVATTGSTVTKNDLIRHCAKQLPKYMIPEHIEFREYLPVTSSGKVDRKKLSEEIITSEKGMA